MRATAFEFRYRFLIITAVYTLGFCCYWLDPRNAAEALLGLLGLGDNLASIRLLIAAGAVVIAAGAMIRTWATAYLQKDVVHDMSLHSDRLVADGPYRYVRNPLYLGSYLMSIGLGLMASRLGFVGIVAANLIFYLRLIYREEAQLSATQGESYQRFLAAVPRLIPSLTPKLPASGRAPQWGQAFVGEAFIWAFAASTLAYAVTLRTDVTYGIVAAALSWYGIQQILLGRRRAREGEARVVGAHGDVAAADAAGR